MIDGVSIFGRDCSRADIESIVSARRIVYRSSHDNQKDASMKVKVSLNLIMEHVSPIRPLLLQSDQRRHIPRSGFSLRRRTEHEID